MAERSVLIAGAGIAGLTAALCFAQKGFSVTVLERAERLEKIGAGLQISPNATRILATLGALDRLQQTSVCPSSICLKSASTLTTLARVPMGTEATKRWGAPYLVAHRADLQQALLDCVYNAPAIALEMGAAAKDLRFEAGSLAVQVEKNATTSERLCDLLVGADGVWSSLRPIIGGGDSNFTGYVAYRATLKSEDIKPETRAALFASDSVTAFLASQFHLVAYPLRGGSEVNLVAVRKGDAVAEGWSNRTGTENLMAAAKRAAPALLSLVDMADWTAWPIHSVSSEGPWVHPGGVALIGDAAHALSPYAAQGAAMAIEDAALLAALVAGSDNKATTLNAFERLRRPRVARVAQRGRFNRFVWHASGPVALGRNLALRLRAPERLAADLDWLYGYDVESEAL